MSTKNKIAYEIMSLLLIEGIKTGTAQIITSQAALETGNFTSTVFKENNNLFGMRYPTERPTTATGEKRGYAFYESIGDCVQDFVLYYRNNHYPELWNTIDEYCKAFKEKGYYESPEGLYCNNVKYFYRLYFVKNETERQNI
ncbi:MAG: glucosaminidase domain-containing protein [Thermotogota bacterium]|nr:glucosaminidase domain-containing protein [Thermotogota bacterium]